MTNIVQRLVERRKEHMAGVGYGGPKWSASELAPELGVSAKTLSALLSKDPSAPPAVRNPPCNPRDSRHPPRWDPVAVRKWWAARSAK
jgi:hypothetical protein